jgi:D-alanyl-D-alanine carboxypeptidase
LGKTKFVAKKSSALVGGTTAKLNVDEVYTLKELLYGMMLPSGNDAAIVVSEVISLMINLKQKQINFDPHSDDWF